MTERRQSSSTEHVTRREALNVLLTLFGFLFFSRMAEPGADSSHKFLLIADDHVGESDVSLRQANADAAAKLAVLLKFLPPHYFTRILHLGDMITDEPTEIKAVNNLKNSLEPYNRISTPSTHVLGNHDVWNISKPQLRLSFLQLGLDDQFYGVIQGPDYRLVYLDLIADRGRPAAIAAERIDWLNQINRDSTPTYIFGHEGFVPQDVSKNYYFKNSPRASYFTNGDIAWRALAANPPVAVISGHLHQSAYLKVNSTHMITVPSFTERIPPTSLNPGVYSILEISGPQFTIQSFHGSSRIFDASNSGSSSGRCSNLFYFCPN